MDIPEKTEHPFQIVKRICAQKKVEPVSVFSSLIYGLSESQTVAGTTFGLKDGSADNQATVIDEIRSMMGMANKNFMPRSVLDLLAYWSEYHVNQMRSCAKEYASFKNVEGYERSANLWEALALIFRELANQSDKQAIQMKLMFDQFNREVERRKNGEILDDEADEDAESD